MEVLMSSRHSKQLDAILKRTKLSAERQLEGFRRQPAHEVKNGTGIFLNIGGEHFVVTARGSVGRLVSLYSVDGAGVSEVVNGPLRHFPRLRAKEKNAYGSALTVSGSSWPHGSGRCVIRVCVHLDRWALTVGAHLESKWTTAVCRTPGPKSVRRV